MRWSKSMLDKFLADHELVTADLRREGPRVALGIRIRREQIEAMAGPPPKAEAASPQCVFNFEECEDSDFGRYWRCVICGVGMSIPRWVRVQEAMRRVTLPGTCPEGAERHHRSCALRSGGYSCTC